MTTAHAAIPTLLRAAAAPWNVDGWQQREWLLCDHRGGYAAGTALDLPTRRYHGWLVAALPPAGQRHLLLAGADERVQTAAGEQSLLAAHWRGDAQPTIAACALAFAHRPLPRWEFRGDGFHLQRQLAMTDSSGVVLVRWQNHGSRLLRLHVRPLLACRAADALTFANDALRPTTDARGASWGWQPYAALPPLWLSVDGGAGFRSAPCWYRGFQFGLDQARGYDHTEDRWSPGVLELDLQPGAAAVAAFAVGEPWPQPTAAFTRAAAAAAAQLAAAPSRGRPLWRLALGAGDFLFADALGRPSVLAGFPWFSEWGRDVFVALPGLTLARGRGDHCAAVLRAALPFLRDGLLPNVYGSTPATSHYDSADAALWFALAVQRWASAGAGPAAQREFLPALAGIAESYLAGSALGLSVDAAGSLAAGSADLNATWMDARTAAGPVTPRQGLAVELNALWFSLLAQLAEVTGQRRWQQLRDRAGAAFVQRFWLADRRCLADRWHDGRADATVRPNMVIAAALPHSPLVRAQRAGVVAVAEAELLTPRGLRTLSPKDPAYRGRYRGGPEQRDAAYHQGTVWPWLAGAYVESALRAAERSELPAVRARLRAWLDGFRSELDHVGLDHVSEVFDGDLPQAPGGTFAQAWNTGELLRAEALVQEPGP